MGGDSGGSPLFSLEGKVIGIGSTGDERSVLFNIYVPIDRYREVWKQLAAGEDFNSLAPKRALLGVGPAEDSGEARIGSIVAGRTRPRRPG